MLELERLEDRCVPANITVTASVNAGAAAVLSVSETGSEVTMLVDGDVSNWQVGDIVSVNGVANGSPYNVEGSPIDSVAGNQITYEAAGAATGLSPIASSGVVVNVSNSVGPLSGVQRSMVDSIVYTFSEPVTLGPTAINITVHPGQPGTYPTTSLVSTDFVHWVLTFQNGAGASTTGGSITNGVYDSTITAADVAPVLADGDAMPGDQVDTFYRLYGDVDGDQTVNNADARALSRVFNSTVNDAAFVAALDSNGDGIINNADSRAFSHDFGTTYSW